MTAIKYVSQKQMKKRTGFSTALGYAFPEEDEILVRKGLDPELKKKVLAHEEDHILKGEEGPGLFDFLGQVFGAKKQSDSANKATDAQLAAAREQMALTDKWATIARDDQKAGRDAANAAFPALMSLTGIGGPQGGSSSATQPQNPFRGIGAAGYGVGRVLDYMRNSGTGRSFRSTYELPRAQGGPTAGGNIYNINELGPENVYAGGALTRNPNPMTIDGQTGYVQPNVQGRATGGFTNEYDYGGTYDPGAGPNRIAGPPKSYAGGVGQIPNGFQTEQFIPPNAYQANGGSGYGNNPAGSTATNPQTGYPNENPGGVEGGYQFQTDPGYQFRFQEGMRALDRSAAKDGGLLSGGYARKAIRYGQGFASNEFSNVYNRISNIAGLGQVANNQSGQYAMNAGANMANAAGNAGYANASGYAAQGDIWGNALRSGGSYLDDVTGGWNPFKKKQTESSGWNPYTDNLSGLGG